MKLTVSSNSHQPGFCIDISVFPIIQLSKLVMFVNLANDLIMIELCMYSNKTVSHNARLTNKTMIYSLFI